VPAYLPGIRNGWKACWAAGPWRAGCGTSAHACQDGINSIPHSSLQASHSAVTAAVAVCANASDPSHFILTRWSHISASLPVQVLRCSQRARAGPRNRVVAPAVFPHHRAYGSVPGGLCRALGSLPSTWLRHEPKLVKEEWAECMIHLRGSRVPPGASSITGGPPSPVLR